MHRPATLFACRAWVKRATRQRCLGLPVEHILLQSRLRLKINPLATTRSPAGPLELAGFQLTALPPSLYFNFTSTLNFAGFGFGVTDQATEKVRFRSRFLLRA